MFKSPISTDAKVVVSNCLYFNGNWEYEFIFEPPDFIGEDGEFKSFSSTKTMTFMIAKLDLPYYKDDENGFEILSLPYEHDSNYFSIVSI